MPMTNLHIFFLLETKLSLKNYERTGWFLTWKYNSANQITSKLNKIFISIKANSFYTKHPQMKYKSSNHIDNFQTTKHKDKFKILKWHNPKSSIKTTHTHLVFDKMPQQSTSKNSPTTKLLEKWSLECNNTMSHIYGDKKM